MTTDFAQCPAANPLTGALVRVLAFRAPARGEATPGSRRYLRDLAYYFDVHAVAEMGPTDAGLSAAAIRYVARRWRRRACRAFVASALVAAVAFVGVTDRNHDGRVDVVDVWLGARAIIAAVPAAFYAATVPGEEYQK